ncbi:MAG: BatA domain-containing protein [Planctomycetaceae bacterium]|nr:BatA domain-containing protein [Planctomycetaceae bacterium]
MYLLFLIIPIVILYIFRLRISTAITSTVFLWQQVLLEQRSKQRWQIRRIISLLLSILFISFLTIAAWNPKIHLPESIFGKPKEKAELAITRFQPRRLFDEPANYEILIEVANTGTETAETMLGVQLNDRLLSAIPLTIPKDSVQQTIIRDASPLGGVLQCALILENEQQDSRKKPIQVTAVTILPPVESQKVLLCDIENIFLQSALQSLPDTEVITVYEVPQIISKNVVLVLNGKVPAELPTGNILIFNPQNDTQFFTVGEPVGIALVEDTDETSQLVKQLGLQNLLLQGARNITFPEPAADIDIKILAKTAEQVPLYILIETPERKVFVFNADLKRSDITSQTVFPLLLSRAVKYFGSSVKETSAKDVSTKEAGALAPAKLAKQSLVKPVGFALTAVCLFWTVAEWFLFQRRKLE